MLKVTSLGRVSSRTLASTACSRAVAATFARAAVAHFGQLLIVG